MSICTQYRRYPYFFVVLDALHIPAACQNINHYFNVPFDDQAVFDDAAGSDLLGGSGELSK